MFVSWGCSLLTEVRGGPVLVMVDKQDSSMEISIPFQIEARNPLDLEEDGPLGGPRGNKADTSYYWW